MAVFVDNARILWKKKLWCHLVADSLDELHDFALLLGLQRSWFQSDASIPHYDITVAIRDRAIKLGAISVNSKEIVLLVRQSETFKSPNELPNSDLQMKLFH